MATVAPLEYHNDIKVIGDSRESTGLYNRGIMKNAIQKWLNENEADVKLISMTNGKSKVEAIIHILELGMVEASDEVADMMSEVQEMP